MVHGVKALAFLAAIACTCAAVAQTPKELVSRVIEWHDKEVRAARTRDEHRAVPGKLKAKAEEAIRTMTVEKARPEDGWAWALLFNMANRPNEVRQLVQKYLSTKPEGGAKFQAQMLLAMASNQLKDADMLLELLPTMEPAGPIQNDQYVSMTIIDFVHTVAAQKSNAAALTLLDTVEKTLELQNPAEAAKAALLEYKRVNANSKTVDQTSDEARLQELEQRFRSSNNHRRFGFVEIRTDLLVKENKKDEAVRALDDFAKTIDGDKNIAAQVARMRSQITLLGAAAPPLGVVRSIGDFTSLDALKGKVVLLDFFAHWCGPCIKSFPDMAKMYTELKSQGLEVVGVTTWYGFYKSEHVSKRDMTRDAEFQKMTEFVADHKLPWPVVFTGGAEFEPYGVTGIPMVAVIGKDGVVRFTKVGYDAKGFADFRAQIEKLLKE